MYEKSCLGRAAVATSTCCCWNLNVKLPLVCTEGSTVTNEANTPDSSFSSLTAESSTVSWVEKARSVSDGGFSPRSLSFDNWGRMLEAPSLGDSSIAMLSTAASTIHSHWGFCCSNWPSPSFKFHVSAIEESAHADFWPMSMIAAVSPCDNGTPTVPELRTNNSGMAAQGIVPDVAKVPSWTKASASLREMPNLAHPNYRFIA